MILRPGNYPSLSAMGMGDRISSARIVARTMPVPDTRYAPAPVVTYDARRRNDERLFDVVYSFRGREHRMQMASPPGRTVTVNSQGEPRV